MKPFGRLILAAVAAFAFMLLTVNAAPPSVTQHGFITTSGGKLYYETVGRGHALVFIHGGQMDRRMWDQQFFKYAKRYKCIRYDVRGYGKSGLPMKGYSDVGDLTELLDFLKVKKVSIIGLSLGGRIAVDFALAHPDMVDSLVLADPGLSGWKWSGDMDKYGEAIFKAARDESLDKSTELWLQNPYMAPAMEKAAIRDRIRRLARDNAYDEFSNPYLNRDGELKSADHLSEIRAPTLILIGDRDVPDIKKIVDALAAGIKGSHKDVITDSGHITNMEQPEQFDRLVLAFLSNVYGHEDS